MMDSKAIRLIKARALRYKRPMSSMLNFDSIREKHEDMIAECDNIRYIVGTNDETQALDALGDRDEAMMSDNRADYAQKHKERCEIQTRVEAIME